jgi:hypothetical protein
MLLFDANVQILTCAAGRDFHTTELQFPFIKLGGECFGDLPLHMACS